MDRKKTLAIIALLITIVTVVVIVLVYFLIKQKTAVQSGNKIELADGLEEKIFFPEYVKKENAIYYAGNQGIKLKKYSLAQKKVTTIYPEEIYFIQKMSFNPDGNKALIQTRQDERIIFKIIDFEKKAEKNLNEDIFDAQWLGNNQIIYSDNLEFNSGLYLINLNDFSKQKLIQLDFAAAKLKVSPDNQKVIIYPEPEGYGENELYLFRLDKKTIDKISDKSLVDAAWNSNSLNILTNQFDENGEIQTLYLINIENKKEKEFKFNSPLDKIGWIDENNFLIAVKDTENDDKLYTVNNKRTIELKANLDLFKNSKLEIQNIFILDGKTVYLVSNDILYKLDLK